MDDRPEFRVSMRVRNGRLLALREELGLTQKQLGKASGVSGQTIGGLETMRVSPVAKNGEWRQVAKDLASFLDTTPSWLFPDAVVEFDQPGEFSRDVSTEDLRHLQGMEQERLSLPGPGARLDEEATRDTLRKLLSTLTPREEMVVRRRYGLDGEVRTLWQVGMELGITDQRVRQIQQKAERKLREPWRVNRLRGLTPDEQAVADRERVQRQEAERQKDDRRAKRRAAKRKRERRKGRGRIERAREERERRERKERERRWAREERERAALPNLLTAEEWEEVAHQSNQARAKVQES